MCSGMGCFSSNRRDKLHIYHDIEYTNDFVIPKFYSLISGNENVTIIVFYGLRSLAVPNSYLCFISFLNCSPIHHRPDRVEVVSLDVLVLSLATEYNAAKPEDNKHVPRHPLQATQCHQSQDLDSTINFYFCVDATGVVTIANSPSFLTNHPHPLP